jgi:hypothetical protein
MHSTLISSPLNSAIQLSVKMEDCSTLKEKILFTVKNKQTNVQSA